LNTVDLEMLNIFKYSFLQHTHTHARARAHTMLTHTRMYVSHFKTLPKIKIS